MNRFLKRLLMLCLVSVTAWTLNLPVAASGGSGNAVEAATNGVVCVYSETLLSNGELNPGIGTAFAVSPNDGAPDIFITNRHVITAPNADGSLTQAQRVYIMTAQNALTLTYRAVALGDTLEELTPVYDANTDRMVACDVLYCSDTYDFAVLRAITPIEGRVALPLAESAESASVADSVYALGYPAVSDDVTTSTGWEFSGNYFELPYEGQILELPIYTYSHTYNSSAADVTLSSGAVSRFTTMTSENGTRTIQHDATLHGGNSGGPLVDADGTVLGINTWSGNASESLNYAIYVDYAAAALDELGISYQVGATGNDSGKGTVLLGVLTVAAIAVVLFLTVRRKKPAPQPAVPAYAAPAPAMRSDVPGDTGLRLQGESGAFADRRFAITGKVRIGREPGVNEIVYPPDVKGISRTHCELSVVNQTLYLKDLGSSYGTYLGGGQRLAANQAVPLQVGDSFSLGSNRETFVIKQKGGQ